MGLSASQARYLQLTARKSNVEFQGQQINQQRTTLANITSSFNGQLLNLNVPTAPSSSDYTKTAYSFSLNAQTCTVGGVNYDNATNTYTVNYTYDTKADKAASGSGVYSTIVGPPVSYQTSAGTILEAVTYASTTPDEQATAAVDRSNLQLLFGAGFETADTYFKYKVNGTMRYVKQDDLAAMQPSTNISYHYVQQDAEVTNAAKFANATVEWNDSGRMTSITDQDGKEYVLNATTTTDEQAYDDAMNQYEYDKQLYEQSINNINAKLDVVHSQDKNLELQLTQLDTEQKAISTEEEAVKKVIEKNTESSFKTFA